MEKLFRELLQKTTPLLLGTSPGGVHLIRWIMGTNAEMKKLFL